MKDVFGSLFGTGGMDDWMTKIHKEVEERQIEQEINELVEKNPEFIHKVGVINSMIKQLQEKMTELDRMKTEVRVDIANRIISASGDKYRGYRFKIPDSSASIFGTSKPTVEKEEPNE